MKLARPTTLQEEREYRVLLAQAKAAVKAEDDAWRPDRLLHYNDPDFEELAFIAQFVPSECEHAYSTAWRVRRRMVAAMPDEPHPSITTINEYLDALVEAGKLTLDLQSPLGKFYSKVP